MVADGEEDYARLTAAIQDLWPGATVAQVRGCISGQLSNAYMYNKRKPTHANSS